MGRIAYERPGICSGRYSRSLGDGFLLSTQEVSIMDLMIYHRAGRESAPRLAAFMGIESALRGTPKGSRCLKDLERPSTLIRYGSAASVPLKAGERVLNKRYSLSQYKNRLEQMRLMRAGGVSVPDHWAPDVDSPLFTMHRRVTADTELLGRSFGKKGRQTTRGRGIRAYLYVVTRHSNGLGDRFNPQDHDFWTEYHRKDRQFRVHVVCGATRTREMILNEDEDHAAIVWNFDNGTYRIPENIPSRVIPAAVQAVAALRLDFGAVDLITVGNECYVLEVNTAPGLGDATLEWYAQHLGWAVGLKTMPGWDAEGLERVGIQGEE